MDLWIKAILSGAVLFMGLFIFVARPKDQKAREFAYWMFGLILGYWFRT